MRPPMDAAAARAALAALPALLLGPEPTPVEELQRLRSAVGGGARLLVQRDDALPFGFGGNKVRKLGLVAARALAEGADTLVTVGGVQSNHARCTAAAAARLGLRCVLILNGARPERLAGNALLDELLGAEIEYVASRAERAAGLERACERLRAQGRRPFAIPLGASTPLGALAYARALGELLGQTAAPDVIVHASSSGGTQAGLIAGCALHGLATRVLGISADEPAAALAARVRSLLEGMGELLGVDGAKLAAARPIEGNDAFVGEGYGLAAPAWRGATRLRRSREALFLDPTYTAKAMAGLIARARQGAFGAGQTVLFWHTGGLPGLFA